MKRYKGYQFRRAVEEATGKVCKSMNLDKLVRIIWTKGLTTAGVNNHGEMYLADVEDDAVLNDADLLKYMGFVVHELCHRAYTEFLHFDYPRDQQYLQQLHNAVEDAFIEHKAINECVTGNVRTLLTTLVDRMVGEAMKVVTDWAAPEQYPFVLAVYLRNHASTKVPLAGGLEPIFAAAAAELVDAVNTYQTGQIAKRVLDKLQKLSSKQNKPKPKQSDKGSGTGDKGPTSGQETDGEAEGAANASGGANDGKASRPTKETRAAEVEPQMNEGMSRSRQGTYSKDAELSQPDTHVGRSGWAATSSTVPAKLRYSVKRLFDNSGLEEFQRNRKSGTVNVHALTKVGSTDRLFKRRLEVDGIDTAVVIAVDVSGSMFDDCVNKERMRTAVQAAAALLDTLRRAQVSTAVVTFGSSTSVLKDWNLPTVKAVEKLTRVRSGASTNDYFAVRYAHEMLLNRAETRKILFVLTDGQGDEYTTKMQVETGKRLGITTIGIGIQLDVSGVYDQYVNVQNLTDLGNASFKQIKLAA